MQAISVVITEFAGDDTGDANLQKLSLISRRSLSMERVVKYVCFFLCGCLEESNISLMAVVLEF